MTRERTGIKENHYRVAYNIISALMFAWVMFSWQGTSVLYVIPGIWSLVMYGIQLFLLLFIGACLYQTGIASFLGFRKGTQSESRLETGGCYSIVRHPVYLASIIFMLLNPVMTGRWLTLSVISSIYMIAGAVVEEKRLLKAFGRRYDEYRRTTGFLIPCLLQKHPQQKTQP